MVSYKSSFLKFFSFVLVAFAVQTTYAQQYGNEWIDYSQVYFRIPIVKKGIYRVSAVQLRDLGVPIANFQPQNLQLFYRAAEQYIYVQGAEDGVFSGDDFIEFYAEGNDGWLDSAMCGDASYITNPQWSMVNDTANYYLTWNTRQNNRRMINRSSANYQNVSSQSYNLFTVQTDPMTAVATQLADNGSQLASGEGWHASFFEPGASQTVVLQTPHYVSAARKSQVQVRTVSSQNTIHQLKLSCADFDTTASFFDAKTSVFDFQIASSISASTTIVAMSTPVSISIPDRNALSYAKIVYPRSFDCDNKAIFSCQIPRIHSESETAISFTNFDGSQSMIVYDTVHHIRTFAVYNADAYNVVLPNPASKSFVFCSAESSINSIASLSSALRFTNFAASNNQGKCLIITHKTLLAKAQEYAQYRQQMGLSTVVVDVDQLYHQFGYGIMKHPMAIKNYCRYALSKWAKRPEYLFIIGKGIDMLYSRSNSSAYDQNLVPVLGWPGTDNMFSFNINGLGQEMALATGRLSAKSADDVDLYLSKIKEYERNFDIADWKKRVLQFSGGGNTKEQALFKGYLQYYQSILEDTLYGGFVRLFSKNSSDPIEQTQSDLIKQEINNGVGLLLFFGHAAATGFDQNIDQPSTYQNKGKYPLLFANSCYNGNIYLTGEQSISEQWVLIKDKGMIGFLANIDLGYAYYLDRYTVQLCRNIAYRNYGQPIGIAIKEAVRQSIDSMPQNQIMLASAIDMTFHGDPALKPYSFLKPDLKITSASISFLPERVSTDVDSFRVAVAIANIGRATRDSFMVKIQRRLPDNTLLVTTKRVKGSYYLDTMFFSLPTLGLLGVGINSIVVTVDDENKVDELNEANNSASTDFVVSSYDVLPVYPSEFAIYPSSSVQLVASNANPRANIKQRVVFEIDTSKNFTSSFKLSAELENTKGLVTWQVPANLKDHSVYYWRVSNVPQSNTDKYRWATSSFIYIDKKTGWGQSRFEQFDKNTHTYINYNTAQRKFDFINTPKKLQCKVKGLASSLDDWRLVQFTIDGSLQSWSGCRFEAALQVAVIDPVTLKPWPSSRSDNGQKNYPICSASGQVNYFYGFNADLAGLNAMTKFLKDSIPNNYYILIYTFYSGNFDIWPETALQTLTDLGSKSIRSIPNRNPYIFFVQKGKPTSVQEKIGQSEQDLISLEVDLPTNYIEGYEMSSIAGPAKKWQTFIWSNGAGDSPKDSALVSIWGITNAGDKVLLRSNIVSIDSVLISDISAQQYPYIQLDACFKDTEIRTPKQLRSWQLFFDPVPETAVVLDDQYLFHRDTIDEGDVMRLRLSTQNISTSAMDSLRVKFLVKSLSNNLVLEQLHVIPQHAAGTTAVDSVRFNTEGYTGKYVVTAEFNPKNAATGSYFQPEQIHFNNIFQKQFYIKPDKLNPILDVTFDGIHILDGDIVSAKPSIVMSLLDENKYHALNDTSLFEVYVSPHGSNQMQRIYFTKNGSEQMQFIPAQAGKNKASIVYKPIFEKDGKYEISIKAKDKSGNQSGSVAYTISFEVILASTITNIVNYPNPFTTATRFVFTVTGSTLPTDLRIQVLTVTGHLVREISLDELGPLHIGRNITQFAWDGTDMFGDRLANGVYYYRVFSRIGTESINNRATDADKYFTKGYGKMYIMR